MQSTTTTPAECLLQRLLHSQKLDNRYAVQVEKKEGHTSIFLYPAGRQSEENTARRRE